LTNRLGQLLRYDSGGNIGAAAGSKADQNLDRSLRILFGQVLGRGRPHAEGEQQAKQDAR
jgi:hypothetical protein